jgi:type II secretion system protein N
MMRWLITIFGSFVWGMVVLYGGLSIFFPSEQVKDFVKYEVQESSNKKYLIDIEEIGFGILGNIKVDNLTLYESSPGRRERGQKETPARENTEWFSLPTLVVRPHLFSLLRGRLMAGLGLETAGGDIDLTVGGDLSHFYLDMDTDGLDLSLIPIELEESLLQLAGSLHIESDLAFNLDEINESTGDLSISIDDLSLVSGTISGFSLPETEFSEAILQMEIEDGKMNVKKGSFISEVLEVTIEGYINLRKNLLRSNSNLKIQIRFDDSYDKLAKIAFKSSRDDDGVYHFRGSGRINNLRFRPDQTKSRSRDRSTTNQFDDERSNSNERPVRKSSALTDEDREERRQKRRDRLQKRRERMRKRREDRREQPTQRDDRAQVDEFDPIDARFEDDQIDNLPIEDMPQQRFDDEIDQDQDYQDYEDPNGQNGNLDDLGYIDE